MNKTVQALILVLCVCLFGGEALELLHPSYGYNADIRLQDDGFSYALSSSAPAEYNVLFTDNSDKSAVETLYLYYDASYGSTYPEYGSIVDQMESRFSDRGLNTTRADTPRLSEILASPPSKTGIVMGSGAIPENLVDSLLLWIKAGGTVYWTYDVIGQYICKNDGTYYTAETSRQSDFLSSECTKMNRATSITKETVTGYSQGLSLGNKEMLGALDTSAISVPFLSIGYRLGTLSEVVLLPCGSGTVCVISGDHDMYQISDLVQVVCSGLTEKSSLLSVIKERTGILHSKEGVSANPLTAGNEYVVYSYVSGLNPPYGKTVRFGP